LFRRGGFYENQINQNGTGCVEFNLLLSEIAQVGSQTSIQVAQQRVVAADIEMVAKMEDC
jgi:hypothetical protein